MPQTKPAAPAKPSVKASTEQPSNVGLPKTSLPPDPGTEMRAWITLGIALIGCFLGIASFVLGILNYLRGKEKRTALPRLKNLLFDYEYAEARLIIQNTGSIAFTISTITAEFKTPNKSESLYDVAESDEHITIDPHKPGSTQIRIPYERSAPTRIVITTLLGDTYPLEFDDAEAYQWAALGFFVRKRILAALQIEGVDVKNAQDVAFNIQTQLRERANAKAFDVPCVVGMSQNVGFKNIYRKAEENGKGILTLKETEGTMFLRIKDEALSPQRIANSLITNWRFARVNEVALSHKQEGKPFAREME